jgi:phosphoglycerate dehydrogenase-like enzyme
MNESKNWQRMTPGQSLVIATNLNQIQNERLAAHWSRPRVIPYSDDRPAWEIPDEADLLFTFYSGWSEAPRKIPPGWPFGLRWIQVASAGVDTFPSWFFSGPVVTCARGVSAVALSEFVLAAVLAHEKRFFDGIRVIDSGEWRTRTLGCIEGKTLGLLGLGAVGKEVAQRAQAFGMRLVAINRSRRSCDGIEIVGSVKELAARSDHLVIAAPLTLETRRLLDAKVFENVKPGLHLINVARGEIIDQEALLFALNSGRVAAATLDVTVPEPLPTGHPFYIHPRVRITPHSAWTSGNNADRLADKLRRNLEYFLAGKPLLDVVDVKRGY